MSREAPDACKPDDRDTRAAATRRVSPLTVVSLSPSGLTPAKVFPCSEHLDGRSPHPQAAADPESRAFCLWFQTQQLYARAALLLLLSTAFSGKYADFLLLGVMVPAV